MCTAITLQTKDFYFGRTLDYDCSYGEEVTITPRNFPLSFRESGVLSNHYAMIGMAHIADDFPLYYDAVNEKGLAMAGLNFVGFAVYHGPVPQKDNIAHFELIPWILSQCATVMEARQLLERMNVTKDVFSPELPTASLHWIISDRSGSITVESLWDGLHVYDNPVGVLTNNPSFDDQMFHLNNFMHLSPKEPKNHFSEHIDLRPYSRGMGAMGLPGDMSSQSRFVRASFAKLNSVCGDSEIESVSQFFHILDLVTQPRGCCDLGDGRYEITLYASCCNADKGIYYYTTYHNRSIHAVSLRAENLDRSMLIRYPLITDEKIEIQNEISGIR